MEEKFKEFCIYTDGGSRGNPGPSAIGVFVRDEKYREIAGFGKKIGIATNNIAEYKAVIEGLIWVFKNKRKFTEDIKINFYLDSNLVYSQIIGVFKIKNAELRNLLFSVRKKEIEVGIPINYYYVPREKNKRADEYVNQALDRRE